jgi:hypothetical protein
MRAIESETVDGIVFPSLIRAREKKTAKRSSQRRHISDVQIRSNERTPLAETKKPRIRGAPLPFTLSQATSKTRGNVDNRRARVVANVASRASSAA